MAKASRDKGKRGELEVAATFTKAGLPADRTAALQAGSVPGAGDVTIRDRRDLFVESKRCETLTVAKWLAQVERECPANSDYVLAFRRSREPWRAIVDLRWLAQTLARLHRLEQELG